MRIDEKEIVRTAQELCNEENEQLHVRPWSRNRHFQIPVWLAAIPAAAIIGFFLGIWTNNHMQEDQPLTALVDTVYVMKEMPDSQKTTPPVKTPLPSKPVTQQVRRAKANQQKTKTCIGQSVMNDKIRYDLLVRN